MRPSRSHPLRRVDSLVLATPLVVVAKLFPRRSVDLTVGVRCPGGRCDRLHRSVPLDGGLGSPSITSAVGQRLRRVRTAGRVLTEPAAAVAYRVRDRFGVVDSQQADGAQGWRRRALSPGREQPTRRPPRSLAATRASCEPVLPLVSSRRLGTTDDVAQPQEVRGLRRIGGGTHLTEANRRHKAGDAGAGLRLAHVGWKGAVSHAETGSA